MVRLRASLVDDLIGEVLRPRVTVVRLGAGFDVRWVRWIDGVARWCEVEHASVFDEKVPALEGSSFWPAYERVERVSGDPFGWHPDSPGESTVVIAEGAAMRLGRDGLLEWLSRLSETSGIRVVFDLPGFMPSSPAFLPSVELPGRPGWEPASRTGAACIATRELTALGWNVEADIWLSARPELQGPGARLIASGVDALRVLRVRAR